MRAFEGTNNKSNNNPAAHEMIDLTNQNESVRINRMHGIIQLALIITADEMS